MSASDSSQERRDDVLAIEAWELAGTPFAEPTRWTLTLSEATASVVKESGSVPRSFTKEESRTKILFSPDASAVVGRLKWKGIDGYPTVYFMEGIAKMRRFAMSPRDYQRLRSWVPQLPIPPTSNPESNLKVELLSRAIAYTALGALHFVFPQYLSSTWGVVLIALGVLNLIGTITLAPEVFVLNGLALIVVGILNMFHTTQATGSLWSPWHILGYLQIGWGFSEFGKAGGGALDEARGQYKGD